MQSAIKAVLICTSVLACHLLFAQALVEIEGQNHIGDDTEIEGTLLVKKDVEFKRDLDVLNDLYVNASAIFNRSIEINGNVVLGNDNMVANPEPGTIRWNGTDFQGWNGLIWVSLSGNTVVGSVTDYDGNTYPTIRLNGQEWMTQNLDVGKYNDGSNILLVSLPNDWASTNFGAWCHYNNNMGNGNAWGKLYNHKAVQSGKLCPTGWKVPSQEDFNQLIDYLGGSLVAGGKMKVAGNLVWSSPNAGATNESGISAQPAGLRVIDGTFRNSNTHGYFWSSDQETSGGNLFSVLFELRGSSTGISSTTVEEETGASVRCMRD